MTLLMKICIFFLIVDSIAAISAGDKLVLEALHTSTNGSYWLNTWDLGADLCGEYGITCDINGSVTELHLYGNRLSGQIPPEIGSLTSLIYLGLYNNQLSGPIPPEIGSLTSLALLGLSNNQLSGQIPPEIGSLTSLVSLGLSNNQLSGQIPPEIGSLTSLEELTLNTNQLSGQIPPVIGSLTPLVTLNLNNNQLSGQIPPEIGSLTSLEELTLNNNQLSGPIPPENGSLISLALLSLNNNQLSGPIPPEIGSLTSLEELNLNTNQLSGQIPPVIGSLTTLVNLYLAHNSFSCPYYNYSTVYNNDYSTLIAQPSSCEQHQTIQNQVMALQATVDLLLNTCEKRCSGKVSIIDIDPDPLLVTVAGICLEITTSSPGPRAVYYCDTGMFLFYSDVRSKSGWALHDAFDPAAWPFKGGYLANTALLGEDLDGTWMVYKLTGGQHPQNSYGQHHLWFGCA